jgi:hypothetical protein
MLYVKFVRSAFWDGTLGCTGSDPLSPEGQGCAGDGLKTSGPSPAGQIPPCKHLFARLAEPTAALARHVHILRPWSPHPAQPAVGEPRMYRSPAAFLFMERAPVS